jgi:Bacterial TSP3 repeat
MAPALLLGAALFSNPTSASAAEARQVVNCLDAVCLRLTATAVDSDGDGFTDADEKHFGTNPHDPRSHPPVLDALEDIANGTLPGYWLEPSIDLVTITPDGHAITSGIGTLYAFGMLPVQPSKLDGLGLTRTVPGVNLGGIGGLNWNIHGDTSGAKPPTDPKSLYADGETGSKGGVGGNSGKWDPSDDGFSNLGVRTAGPNGMAGTDVTTHWGKTDDSGNSLHHDVTVHGDDDGVPSGETVRDTVQHPDGSTDKHTTEFGADGKVKSSTVDKVSPNGVLLESVTTDANGKTTDNMSASEKAAAKAEEKRLADDKAAADKKAADDKAAADKKAEEDKAKGTYVDPNYDSSASNPFADMTPGQVRRFVEQATGVGVTHVGDTGTGIKDVVDGGGFIRSKDVLVHTDPDAEGMVVNNPGTSGPNKGGAGPEYDPRLPVPFPFVIR